MDNQIGFTIIVVCYNPGNKLIETLNSIFEQDYWNYEVIIKDGASTDGCIDKLTSDNIYTDRFKNRLHIYTGKDTGIYDAMNIALKYKRNDHIEGSYVLFLNCGDFLHDKQTLGAVADYISNSENKNVPRIFYGNQFNLLTKDLVSSMPKLNEFALYRNVPCHQVCFYHESLFEKRGYDTKYKVRADYEHFLSCIYEENASTEYMDLIVSDYEGGGFSETKANLQVSKEEHREITNRYMGKNAGKYRMIMILTGAGIRTWMAGNPALSGTYNKIKSLIYGIKKKNTR